MSGPAEKRIRNDAWKGANFDFLRIFSLLWPWGLKIAHLVWFSFRPSVTPVSTQPSFLMFLASLWVVLEVYFSIWPILIFCGFLISCKGPWGLKMSPVSYSEGSFVCGALVMAPLYINASIFCFVMYSLPHRYLFWQLDIEYCKLLAELLLDIQISI